MAMKPGTKTLTLRIPEDLKFQIERAAFKDNRSVNNFIQHIIIEYLNIEKEQTIKK